MNNSLKTIGAVLALVVWHGAEAEMSYEMCKEAVSSLGLRTTPYELKEGFFSGTKHIFGDSVECYGKGDTPTITSGSRTVAEDGFFGPEALAARDAALAIKDQKISELKRERDDAIAAAKRAYDNDLRAIEEQSDSELEAIRNDNIPDSVAAAAAELRIKKEQEVAAKRQKEQERKEAAEQKRLDRERAKAERQAAKAAEQEENNRKGFHCLSALTGAQPHVVRKLKTKLNDPGSFKHVETKVAPENEGAHIFTMQFRAKNGFGATVVQRAQGIYSNTDCADVVILSVE